MSPRREKEPSIYENKAQYLRNKKRQELETLEADLRRQRAKLMAVEDQMGRDVETMKEKHVKEIDSVEQTHKEMLELVNAEKEKIVGSVS